MAMDNLTSLKAIQIVNEKEVDYWPSWSTKTITQNKKEKKN